MNVALIPILGSLRSRWEISFHEFIFAYLLSMSLKLSKKVTLKQLTLEFRIYHGLTLFDSLLTVIKTIKKSSLNIILMDCPPEEQNSFEKCAEKQKESKKNYSEPYWKIQLKNTNQMKNNESQQEQAICSESIGNTKAFDYSMNSSYSLHSHLSTAQKIEQIKSERDNQFHYEEQICFKKSKQLWQKQVPEAELGNTNALGLNEKINKESFMRQKNGNDIQTQYKSQHFEELDRKDFPLNKNEQQRKSYKSCLREIVYTNNFQRSKRQFEANDENQERKVMEKDFNENENKQQIKAFQNDQRLSVCQNDNSQIDKLIIKPISITEKKLQKAGESPQSLMLPQTKKKIRQQLQIRRIPSELFESYDQLLLTFNANDKKASKDHMVSPIKLKQKPYNNLAKKKQKQNQKSDDSPKPNKKNSSKLQANIKNKVIDQESLVSFPVVQGYCHLKTDNQQIYQTKYLMNKNTICFQAFKKILISDITKIKMIQKYDKQITIKITYEPQAKSSKPQNFMINILTESFEIYFSESYQFFSHIILRKMILMKICINQIYERQETESQIKSPQSSPLSSPMTLPIILPRKASQSTAIQQNQGLVILQSNLYKKSTFFSSWEKKYFTLTSKSLQSYASPPITGEKQKASTQLTKTAEIWTRFQLTYGYLVIKMWQSKIQKFQIGIPLCDFTNPEGQNNWLYGLSRNILWKKPLFQEERIKTTIAN